MSTDKAEGLSPTLNLRDEAIRWREDRCGHTGGPDDSLEPYCCQDCIDDAEKNVLPLLERIAALAVQEATAQLESDKTWLRAQRDVAEERVQEEREKTLRTLASATRKMLTPESLASLIEALQAERPPEETR